MKFNRSSGILLHPTSLPGDYGIGDLGPVAYQWIDFLKDSGSKLWQVLPLGPTGYGDSPYQCFSAFAGNPNLISPELLVRENLLTRDEILVPDSFPTEYVDFARVIPWKTNLLDQAYQKLRQGRNNEFKQLDEDFRTFQEEESPWLVDYSIFKAIKTFHQEKPWFQWEKRFHHKTKDLLVRVGSVYRYEIESIEFRQFMFFRQWKNLRSYANENGIQIIGDIPIFTSHDSSDVWANPDLFFLDDSGNPTVVAGVPPDYFSPTGQLWGNPLYNWDKHQQTGYSWWIERLKSTLKTVDIIRLDHFRGFAGYWEVPAGNPTAEIGKWVPGPGAAFFSTLESKLGSLPIIAEDLGEITPDVIELRDKFNLPGMKILQFAFGTDFDDPFLPHNYPSNCTAYTGTHDNDTSLGWFNTTSKKERVFCLSYLKTSKEDVVWDMIKSIWSSPANLAITTMQDILNLDSNSRMNYPGRLGGNWKWRMSTIAYPPAILEKLKELNKFYDR